MMEDRIKLLKEKGAYLEGHFKLSSGLHSSAYIQCAQVLQYPDIAKKIGKFLANKYKKNGVDLVVSPAIGGIIIGHEVARALGCKCIFGERENDEMKLRRGFEVKKGEKCLIVEDVITTGKATKDIWELVEKSEGIIIGVCCIVDRSQGLKLSVPINYYVKFEIINYQPEECPLCKRGEPLVSPGSRWLKKQ